MSNGKRGQYTLEFNQEAVRLVESGHRIAKAARRLEVVEQRCRTGRRRIGPGS
jgi:transposase